MQMTRETWIPFLGRKDPLEKEMATCSSILAWEIPWREEPGGLQSMGSERLGDDLAAKQQELMQSTRSIQKHFISINEQLIARKGNEENNFIYNNIKKNKRVYQNSPYFLLIFSVNLNVAPLSINFFK